MIRRFIKSRSLQIAVVCVVLLGQSCNRGVGCPTKFSLFEMPGELLRAISVFF